MRHRRCVPQDELGRGVEFTGNLVVGGPPKNVMRAIQVGRQKVVGQSWFYELVIYAQVVDGAKRQF